MKGRGEGQRRTGRRMRRCDVLNTIRGRQPRVGRGATEHRAGTSQPRYILGMDVRATTLLVFSGRSRGLDPGECDIPVVFNGSMQAMLEQLGGWLGGMFSTPVVRWFLVAPGDSRRHSRQRPMVLPHLMTQIMRCGLEKFVLGCGLDKSGDHPGASRARHLAPAPRFPATANKYEDEEGTLASCFPIASLASPQQLIPSSLGNECTTHQSPCPKLVPSAETTHKLVGAGGGPGPMPTG